MTLVYDYHHTKLSESRHMTYTESKNPPGGGLGIISF